MEARLTDDPGPVLDAASPFLARRPVEHNLVLTLLHQRLASPEPGRYAWATDGDDVVGVLFQSPLDLFAAVTPTPREAVDHLVAAMADVAPDLPGVNGDAATSAAFAGSWATRLRTPAATVEAHRLYACDELHPTPPVPGGARPATEADFDLVAAWRLAFHDETGAQQPVSDPAAAERAFGTRQQWLWCDSSDDPTSLVGESPTVHGVARIGPVYTPPERRSRGYATALTGHVTGAILARGDTASLFTELTNPVSNAIYQRLGYQPVCEFVRYRFG